MAEHDDGIVGIAVTAAAAFGLGLLAGVVAGEWLGGVNAARVRRAVDRLRPEVPPGDAAALEGVVRRAAGARAVLRVGAFPGRRGVVLAGRRAGRAPGRWCSSASRRGSSCPPSAARVASCSSTRMPSTRW